jgi:hypothetical protein
MFMGNTESLENAKLTEFRCITQNVSNTPVCFSLNHLVLPVSATGNWVLACQIKCFVYKYNILLRFGLLIMVICWLENMPRDSLRIQNPESHTSIIMHLWLHFLFYLKFFMICCSLLSIHLYAECHRVVISPPLLMLILLLGACTIWKWAVLLTLQRNILCPSCVLKCGVLSQPTNQKAN